MDINETVLKDEERIAFILRSLYRQYGFLQYKMSKFEEYDLYANCRDFLVSDNIITFTDTNGRLMALKPDVTLSIVRSTREIPGYVNKVFYNENVYRIPHGSHSFKEIMQVGLECIGAVDDYNIFETVLLAVKSLSAISSEHVVSLSHLNIISSLLEELGLDKEEQKQAVRLTGKKNMHEFKKFCGEVQAGHNKAAARSIDEVADILMLNGESSAVIEILESRGCDAKAVNELKALTTMLNAAGEGERIVIDFSVVSDPGYYNGIVFNGYIKGVPESVLNGGQYDALLKKMEKSGKAVGFAVYMDFLERYFEKNEPYELDAVIKYDEHTDRRYLFNALQVALNKGLKVTAQKEISDKLRYKTLYRIDEYGALREVSNA